MASACQHLKKPNSFVTARLVDPTRWRCDTCHSTDGVWVCLGCGHAGCSREATSSVGGGHALHHHAVATHPSCKGACVLDVVSQHAHCYECDGTLLLLLLLLLLLRTTVCIPNAREVAEHEHEHKRARCACALDLWLSPRRPFFPFLSRRLRHRQPAMALVDSHQDRGSQALTSRGRPARR